MTASQPAAAISHAVAATSQRRRQMPTIALTSGRGKEERREDKGALFGGAPGGARHLCF